MNTTANKPRKVKVTLSIWKEAQDTMLDHGYASVRTMGEFISTLIIDYHARQTSKPTPKAIAVELRRLANLMDAQE